MSKRGENIYKRKDGRWEGRYIKERSADGKARYAYVYGKSYADAKQKLLDRRIAQAQNIDCSPSHTKYGDILRNWIAMSRVHIKESTYSRYVHLANVHILPYLGELPTDKLTTQTVEKHISFLLNKGRVDKKGGLAPKTVSDILTLIKGSIDYANCSGYSVNCYLDRLTVKKTQLDMRVLSIDEQHRLCDILMRDMNLTKFGVLLCMYTGIRIGEVCALKWESIDFSEGILSIRETLQRIQATDVGACKKTKIVITEPKSKKAIRDIPLPGFVLEYAASLKHNTEYWLAYCISAVMLWASNEPEAAQRAMSKSLSVNYFNSCLFYLLINLRFNRIEAAKKWYVNYLDRADMNDLGDEWQYLLQAYLFGAFGSDEEFQNIVAQCFQNMLGQVEVTTVDFAKKFTKKAIEFAELYVHKSELEYTTLRRTCSEYSEMHSLLSTAEKNAEIAKYYDSLSNAEGTEGEDLSQRIENVLYSLVNDYDDDELKVVQKIKYNEAVINARGDIAIAQANYDAMFVEQQKKKNLGDLLLSWAFADDSSQADVSVKRFSISFMKEAIAKGFEKFVESYRAKEKEKYTFTIDDCTLTCGEDDLAEAEKKLDAHYDKNKLRDTFKDKFVLIYSVMCAASVVLLLVLLAYFSPVILTIAILVGLAGSFLLWRRIVDMGKILKEKKRKGKLLLKQALDELTQWRKAYKEADAQSADMLNAIASF